MENRSRPGLNRALVMVALLALLLAVVSTTAYWFGTRGLRAVKSSSPVANATADAVRGVDGFMMQTTAGLAAVGMALALALVNLTRRCREIVAERESFVDVEAKRSNASLQAMLAESRAGEMKMRTASEDAQRRLGDVTQALAQLQEEFNRRKRSERELTEQRQALERSKDVLELHVQARTAQLDKLQRQYEGILNSAGEGICGLDLSGRVIFANPAAARITGWKVEELVGLSAREVFCGKPAEVEDEEADGNGEARQQLETNDGEDTVFYRKDGSVYPVEHLRSPVHEKNQLVGEVIVFKDITERKHAEAKLAQKAAELARSNDELEQFAFVASHDLQEPLRKIQAFGDRLKLRTEKLDLGDARDYLDRMQSAAARMQRLISDLLTFSRAIRSSQPFVPVDLGVTTREVLNDLEVRIEQSKARVEVGPLPTIEADPTQMRQLLQNLIGNALKFQRPGNPGVVRIRVLSNGEVRPARFNGDGRDVCELVVEDNGIGFDPKYSEKIFAVFQRLHGRTEYEGTGIGLAVCRRIVDRHRGEIIAHGRPGEGAAFTIHLPLRQPPETETHEHTEQTADHTHGG